MQIAISNIAWPPEDDAAVAGLLAELGVAGIEVAPTVIWPLPVEVTRAKADAFREAWEHRAIRIVALQSLLYGRPDLLIFGTAEKRAETLDYLRGVFRLAGWLGAPSLVFGSPRNRRVAGLSATVREKIATDFFRAAGDAAMEQGVVLCLEPNPREYDCDFVRTADEARALVDAVGSPGFGLHLDSGTMTLAGDTPDTLMDGVPPRHFHISEPHLAPVGRESVVDHAAFSAELQRAGYEGWCSIEMKAPSERDSLQILRRALEFARIVYGDAAAR